MTELSTIEEATPVALLQATVNFATKERIVPKKTIVYQTLIDPTVVRIEGEKAKSKLFRKFLFKLSSPEEIQFGSIEKYYEPFIVVSSRYFIDYYRKRTYSVKVDKEAKEVILLGHSFMLKQTSGSSPSDGALCLEGEERLVRETRDYVILNGDGQYSKLNEFPSAPSESNPLELMESFRMPEVTADVELEVVRRRIARRPVDVYRIVDEELEIDERSVIYVPRFKLLYRCPKIDKEDYLVFDGVTLKQIPRNGSSFSVVDAVVSTPKRLFKEGLGWIKRKLNLR